MKNILIISLASFLLLLINCKKDEIKSKSDIENILYYTDLHDTIIKTVQGYSGDIEFNLDIDKDGIYDVNIETHSFHASHTLSLDYVKVAPLNDYNISYSECATDTWSSCDSNYISRTVMIPKTFELGDTIFIDDNFTKDSLMIYYNKGENTSLGNCPSYDRYKMQTSSNFYIAFFKEMGTKYYIAYLKIKDISANSITLSL